MEDTMIQEREFVKMWKLLTKNIRNSMSYRDIHSVRSAAVAPSTSNSRKVQRARPLSFEHSGLPRSSGPVGMLV